MTLFEIHQRFKGHFLNELCVSFKNDVRILLPITMQNARKEKRIPLHLRRYDTIKTRRLNFFKFSSVVHNFKICKNQV